MIHGTRESKILGGGGCFVRYVTCPRFAFFSMVLACLRVVVDVFEVVVEFLEVVVGGCRWL